MAADRQRGQIIPDMKKLTDRQIIISWRENARPWVNAVRQGEIESRRLVTNKAVVDAVLARSPKTVLDMGCGEGWLTRELSKAGINTLGVDVVTELIASAREAGGGRFRQLSFEEISPAVLQEKFDVIVCNFSLLGDECVVHLFQQAPALLTPAGSLIVQTLHPVAGCGDAQYKDGWREGTWAGFSEQFRNPAPWYFRTMETWKDLFLQHGFRLHGVVEPIHPVSGKPASVIFTAISTHALAG